MTIIYIIAGVILIGFLFRFVQNKKSSNSPYHKIQRKLKDDFLSANFSGDWRRKQTINLQLIWLKTIKEVESRNTLGDKNGTDQTSILAKLTEDEIKFPTKWKLDDFYHFPFSQEILAGYGKLLTENDYKFYKPESTLPFPKKFIKKAILFTFDYLNYDKPLYEIPDKQKVADNLNSVKYILLENFVDTDKRELPKDGIENFRVGKQLREEQPINEERDLHLITWRDYMDWIRHGVNHADKEQYTEAFICFDKARELNPESKDLDIIVGIANWTVGERYIDKGDREIGFDYIKKAAALKNDDAIKWLQKNS
jgi:tetratricopeptide (TPR) repeat protein